MSSKPCCTSDGAGNVICAATATDGNLQCAIFNGTKWSTSAKVLAVLYSAPSCAEYLTRQVLCVVRNGERRPGMVALQRHELEGFLPTSRLPLFQLPVAPLTTTAVCLRFHTTRNATLVNRNAASRWEGFLNVGSVAGGVPDCTSMNSGGKVACFAKAYSSGLFVNVFNGGSWVVGDWSVYGGRGGASNDNVGRTSQAARQLVCGATAALNSLFYADVYNGSSWTGFTQIDAKTGVGSPSCAPLGTRQAVCVVMGSNSQLSSVVGPSAVVAYVVAILLG